MRPFAYFIKSAEIAMRPVSIFGAIVHCGKCPIVKYPILIADRLFAMAVEGRRLDDD